MSESLEFAKAYRYKTLKNRNQLACHFAIGRNFYRSQRETRYGFEPLYF